MQQLTNDFRDLLDLFGLPYVDAPFEAEAQCAALNLQGVCDGVASDDSDTLLFGAKVLYRHLFSRKHKVTAYSAANVEKRCGLDRGALIEYAQLVGSDYAVGVRNIGKVKATEIISDFCDENGKNALQVQKK